MYLIETELQMLQQKAFMQTVHPQPVDGSLRTHSLHLISFPYFSLRLMFSYTIIYIKSLETHPECRALINFEEMNCKQCLRTLAMKKTISWCKLYKFLGPIHVTYFAKNLVQLWIANICSSLTYLKYNFLLLHYCNYQNHWCHCDMEIIIGINLGHKITTIASLV